MRDLSSILERHRLLYDTSPLKNAAAYCGKSKPAGKNSWGYSVNRLIFRLVPNYCVLPSKIAELNLIMDVNLCGSCVEDKDSVDPLCLLAFEIAIEGKDTSGKPLYFFWYMDRHELKSGDTPPDNVHPRYHFQHGGRILKQKQLSHGDNLFLEPPRIAHPPLDAILGVDFLLSNFLGNKWKKLKLEDNQYNNLVQKSQELFWKPYMTVAMKAWGTNTGQATWQANHNWPQIV